jgi:putative flippase GtrA
LVEKARRLDEKYSVFRAARFGIAALVGFAIFEALVVAGLYAFYGRPDVPSSVSTSPSLLTLDVVALVVGVSVSFALNERITVRGGVNENNKKVGSVLMRLLRFQGVSALGNAVVIGVQLLLLALLGLTPAIGSIAGAIVGYPVSYFISMRVVWKTHLSQQF